MTSRFPRFALVLGLLAACGTSADTGSGGASDLDAGGDNADGDAISLPDALSGDDTSAADPDASTTPDTPSFPDTDGRADTGDDDSGPSLPDIGVPDPVETACGNGVDDDRDGNVDCADPDCAADPVCASIGDSEFSCVDGIDNDGNGAVDCDDAACVDDPACAPPPPPAIVDVVIEGFAMNPDPVEVAVGTTVRWTNLDASNHTVTSGAPGAADAGAVFDSGNLRQGDTFEHTFDAPGSFSYFCRPHAGFMFGYRVEVAAP